MMIMLPSNDLRSSLWPIAYRLGFLATFLLVSWLPGDWIDAMLRHVVGSLQRLGGERRSLSLTLKDGRTE